MRIKASLAVLVVLLLSGCSEGGAAEVAVVSEAPPAPIGDTATWQVLAPDPVGPTTRNLTLGVTRLSCAGGKTGAVLTPQVTYETTRIVIRTDAAPLSGGAFTCQGNDSVTVEVRLGEPVGDRELVDAACLEGEAATTAACSEALT